MEKVPFYSPELNRQQSELTADTAEILYDLLNSPFLKQEIEKGNITLAMIRPKVGPEANLLALPDQEAADTIEKMIQSLAVMAKFSIQFTAETVNEFYEGGPQQSMLKEPPMNPQKYRNRWPEFVEFMSSAPTTILLLHSPDGDAIPKWRDHLGHWNIDEVRDMNTIRGQLGANKYNNLVHGSDSPESVLRELGIISKQLAIAVEQKNQPNNHIIQQMDAFRGQTPEAEWLEQIGLLGDSSEAYEYVLFNDWQRMGGESYVIDFALLTPTETHRLIAKACVKIPPTAVMDEWLGRRQLVSEEGISTPQLYAVKSATLLEEFIPFTLAEAYNNSTPDARQYLEEEFRRTYTKLHKLGFKPMSLHDVRSRGNDVVLVDFGEDLGGIFTPSELPEDIGDQAHEVFMNLLRK